MNGYPIVLTGLSDRRCVVIGGGAVAARKAAALIEAGARPVVISPEIGPELAEMARAGHVEVLRRPYRAGDLKGAALVVAATGDHPVNAAVAAEAQRRGVPVNVADDPGLCTFFVPAVIRRGDLLVAVSTTGGSPALARHLREALEQAVEPVYGDLLAVLAELRPQVLQQFAPAGQRLVWGRLLDGELLACARSEGLQNARERARQILASFCRPSGTAQPPAGPAAIGPRTDPDGKS